jgi:propionyl-CoA carboxylase beta chain
MRGDVNYAWPTGGDRGDGRQGRDRDPLPLRAGRPGEDRARTKDYEDRFANPFVAAERGFIDEVIMPPAPAGTA